MSDIVSSSSHQVRLFMTCPQSEDIDRYDYVGRVINVSRWSEEFDCHGMLIYADNGLLDPWLTAQIVVQNTQRLIPLIAVQPIYMSPYSVAKLVTSIAHLHDRQIGLNIRPGFHNELMALGDTASHDDRYIRLTEYAQIIRRLLEGDRPVKLRGRFYSVKNLKMTLPLRRDLRPEIFVSGSSAGGMAAAAELGATALRYLQPAEFEAADRDVVATRVECGARVGIVAREDGDEARHIALERFPPGHRGQHQLAMRVRDSVWHRQLSQHDEQPLSEDKPYWLSPMRNYKTFCPYLVGSYSRVALEFRRYLALGFRTFILDIPPSRDELAHVAEVFRRATDHSMFKGAA
jgi:alkanesulfonate monooxygenase